MLFIIGDLNENCKYLLDKNDCDCEHFTKYVTLKNRTHYFYRRFAVISSHAGIFRVPNHDDDGRFGLPHFYINILLSRSKLSSSLFRALSHVRSSRHYLEKSMKDRRAFYPSFIFVFFLSSCGRRWAPWSKSLTITAGGKP